MRLVDARRLTGPSHLARTPLVIVELALDVGESVDDALEAYRSELFRMREVLGLSTLLETIVRVHRGGVIFGYEAPIDVMLACAEMSEWAALSAVEVLAGRSSLPMTPKREEIEAILTRDRDPRLLALEDEARRRGLPFLWDDARVTVGAGRRSITFDKGVIPAIENIVWGDVSTIPIVLITGTNGKTTSSRLLARIGREAGLVVGSTSTDGIHVGRATIEEGDWTGPAAARVVLRHPDVELAVLETARGGILRRGLAIEACDAALVTNVSDDHLGAYGIDDVAAMTRVKGVVGEAVRKGGTLVLNARDPNLVALARDHAAHVTLFADLDVGDEAARDEVRMHRSRGGDAIVARDGVIVCAHGEEERPLARVDAIPITFGGVSRFNVENVLGVVALARSLGLSDDAIVRALVGFTALDNPRRGELVERGGVRILLDFGHNPEGIRAVMRMVSSLRGASPGRLTVITGSAGDRTDHEIDELARAVHDASPDRVFARELLGYLRGRSPGEVPALFEHAFRNLGLPAEAFAHATSEVDALQRALDSARPGDFIVLLVHLDHDEVRAMLAR